MVLDVRALVAELRGFGLDEAEAFVYYHLSRLGGARAADIAAAAKRKRPDTYRILDSLVAKGFAEKTLERPTRFIPIAIEQALQGVLDVRAARMEELAAKRGDLAQKWPKPTAVAGPSSQRFTVFQGREQVHGLLARMLEEADEDVSIVASPGGLARLGLRAMLADWDGRSARSVRTRILTKPEGHDDIEAFLDNAEVRYLELSSFHQMIIVDAKQIALFVSGGQKLSTTGEEETVLWLNSPDFVLGQKALFDEVWATGLAHTEREAAHAESRRPRECKLLRGRWQRIDRMRSMIGRAQATISIIAPAEEVERWTSGPVQRLLAQALKRGIKINAWSDGDPPVPAVTMATPPDVMIVIVDGAEVLQVYGAREEPGAVAFDGEWAFWSTHEDAVIDARSRMVAPITLDVAVD